MCAPIFAPDGTFISSFNQSGTDIGQFNAPKGLTYDSDGYLYIVDSGNNRVCLALPPAVIGTSGGPGTALGQFQGPVNLGVGERGVCVADTANSRVQLFDPLLTGCGEPQTPFVPRLALSSEIPLNSPRSASPVGDLLQEKIYIADTGNGRVVLVTLPGDDPLSAWNSMVAQVLARDIPSAVTNFSQFTAEDYRDSFLSLGTDALISDISAIGTLTPVFIRNSAAEYYFEQTIDGFPLLFPVEFVRENGFWRIREF